MRRHRRDRGRNNVIAFRRPGVGKVPDRDAGSGNLAVILIGVGAGLLLGMAAFSLRSSDAEPAAVCVVTDVHDGDTIRCGNERVRLSDIDAPEMPGSPKCRDPRRSAWCNYDLAYRSRDALRAFLKERAVTIQREGTDRYGRTLAKVYANGAGAGDHLVNLGLARPWR